MFDSYNYNRHDNYQGRPHRLSRDEEQKLLSGRVFALVLIGTASLYVVIMICQAYINNRDRMMTASSYESQYEYPTESYDFRPYQSLDTDNIKSE